MIPAQRVVRIKGETMDVIVHRNKCAGVRACAQTGCSTSYPIAYASQKCPQHQESTIIKMKCDAFMIYVHPLDPKDKRRWMGVLHNGITSVENGQDHPRPVETAFLPDAEHHAIETLRRNPGITPSEIKVGVGTDYSLPSRSIAFVDTHKIARLKERITKDTTLNLLSLEGGLKLLKVSQNLGNLKLLLKEDQHKHFILCSTINQKNI
jgi:hypothetical protein